MAKKITIRGIIGLSEKATPEHLEDSLTDSGHGDIEVTFASPGGFVSAGIEMSNMIRDYGGRTTAIITGQAASMASYMPMMFDHVSAYDNTILMIHNPYGGVLGADYRDASKFTAHMIGLRDLLAHAYADKSGKPIEEIHQMMDDETFLYGKEIVENGFADELIKSESGPQSKLEAKALAQAKIQDCQAKMKENEEEMKDDFERAAAFLKSPTTSTKNQPAAAGTKVEEANKMASLKDFLAANSDAKTEYESAVKAEGDKRFAEGETAGKQVGKDEAKAVYAVAIPILSSAHYPEALKTRVTEKAQAGDVEAVKDYVAMYDMTAEGIATAAAIKEQGEETPASGGEVKTDAQKSEEAFQARLVKSGRA